MRNILEIKLHCLAGISQEEIKAFLEDNGYEWKDWYFDPVCTPSQIIENYPFWKETSECTDNIRPCDVIGHHHGSISENTDWITLLSCPKRHKYDTDPQSVLSLLKEQVNIPGDSDGLILLEKYGTQYFISMGRHRMVQAKFLKIETVHCRVKEFVFDKEVYDLYCRIQARATIIEEERWKLGQPVKAILDSITFEIPLTEEAVAFFERSIETAQELSQKPIRRWLYFAKNRKVENACTYFNLKNINSSDALVLALLHSFTKKCGSYSDCSLISTEL